MSGGCAPPPAPLRAVVWWSRAWGLAPYGLDAGSGLFAASARLRALSVAVSLLLAGCTVLFILVTHWDPDATVGTAAMQLYCAVELTQCLTLCPVLWWQLHPHLLPLLNADPVRLGAADVPLHYPFLTLAASVAFYSASLLNTSIHGVPHTHGLMGAALSAVLSMLCHTNQLAVTTYFCFLVHSLERQLAALNQTLLQYLVTLKLRGRKSSPSEQLLKGGLVSVRRAHARTIAALNVVSRCFQLPLTLQGVADLWDIVSFLYMTAGGEVPAAVSLSKGVWVVGNCVRWGYVIAASFMVTTQSHRTKIILNDFISEGSGSATTEELSEVQRSCLILSQQPARVVFLGIEVNGSLLWQIAAACATYVVMLMQFHSSCETDIN